MTTKSAPAIALTLNEDTDGIDNPNSLNETENAAAAEFRGLAEDTLQKPRNRLPAGNFHLPDDFTYSWKDLSVDISLKKRRWKCWKERPFRRDINRIPILRSLSGALKSGELWALMGASGAGKTTLLNSINFRNQHSVHVTGSRCINGVPIDPENITAVSAYLQQSDLFPDCLTCREHLMFTAALRLPSKMSSKQRSKRVDEVLREVGLWHVRNVYIRGVFSQGISTGQKKLLAFASEILADPSIFFCDEPTTGLDSFMAKTVVDIMKKIAGRGKLVVCTIHQPSTEVYKCFDHLYLLAEGRLAYAGTRLDTLKFFTGLGYKCPATHNPADFFVQTTAIIPDHAEECRQKLAEISLAFAYNEQYQKLKAEINMLETEAPENKKLIQGIKKSRVNEVNLWVQFAVIFFRFVRVKFRDPKTVGMRILAKMFLALVLGVGTLDFKDPMDMIGVGAMTGILIMAMLVEMTFSIYANVTSIPDEIPLTMREHWNGLYSLLPFYLARTLMETLFFTFLTLFFFPIIYFMSGMTGPLYRLGYHMITVILITNGGAAGGAMISNLSPNVPIAVVLGILILSPFLLFSGFFTDDDKLQPPLNYMKYLSMDFYAAENMMSIQWKSVKTINGRGMMKKGEDVLAFYQYGNNYWRNTGILAISNVVYRVLACVILLIRGRR